MKMDFVHRFPLLASVGSLLLFVTKFYVVIGCSFGADASRTLDGNVGKADED